VKRLAVIALALALLRPEARADEAGEGAAQQPPPPSAPLLAMVPSHAVGQPALPEAGATHERDTRVAALPIPLDVFVSALPPPPQVVILDPGYYGSVTVNHAAHLARRAACKSCHGPGPVQKLGRLSAADAHGRCRGCHEEIARGPTDCRGCHMVPPEPSPASTALAAAAEPGKPAPGASDPKAAKDAAPDRVADSAALAENELVMARQALEISEGVGLRTPPAAAPASGGGPSDAAARVAPAGVEPAEPFPSHLSLRRSVASAMTVISSSGQKPAVGVMLGTDLRGDGLIVSYSIEWAGNRTLGLLGGGVTLPIHDQVNVQLQAVGGMDSSTALLANVVPALGARAGLEWIPRRAVPVRSVRFAVSGLGDLSQHRAVEGERSPGRFTVTAWFGAALDLAPR
jgi:hypothetical protein